MHHERLARLVHRSHEFFADDHLGDDGMDRGLVEFEHLRQRRQRDGVVNVGVGEEIGPQALFLDLLREHLPDLVRLVEQIPNLREFAKGGRKTRGYSDGSDLPR